jgi:MFS family permease
MRTFFLIWSGQVVSLLGSSLGSFALGVWVYERTGSVTRFSLMALAAGVATLLVTPLAGSLADRLDRRRLLLACDAASGLITLLLALAFVTGRLALWHVYPIVMGLVCCGTVQALTLTASVSVLVPAEHLARVSGIAQATAAVTQIVGPLLAGILVGRIGYPGIFLMDSATFFFAAATLFLARIPRLPASDAPATRPSVWRDARLGWRYIRERPGLFSLLLLFAAASLSLGFVQILLTPLILSFGTAADLGRVSAVGATGALLGGVTLAVWGGPRRRVLGILLGLLAQGLLLFVAGLRPQVGLIAFAAFAFLFASPILNGCNQAIWQSKTALDVQGRVFAVRTLAGSLSLPLAAMVAGPLADRFFEPLLAASGPLAGSAGRLLGTGPGRGIGLLFLVLGAILVITTLLISADRRLRWVESELPDAPLAGANGLEVAA